MKIFETLEGVLGKEKALKVAEAIEKLFEERIISGLVFTLIKALKG